MRQRSLLVLFVSTGNAGRSLMAEAILNAKKSDLYYARTAGVAPLDRMAPETKVFLERAGFETQKLYPKGWQDFRAANDFVPVDAIVTLSESARQSLPLQWPGDPVRAHWVLDNPLGADRADVQEWKFRKCYSLLQTRIDALLKSRPVSSRAELWLKLKDIAMMV